MVENDLLDNEDKVKVHFEDMESAVLEGKDISSALLSGNIDKLSLLFRKIKAESEAQIAGTHSVVVTLVWLLLFAIYLCIHSSLCLSLSYLIFPFLSGS